MTFTTLASPYTKNEQKVPTGLFINNEFVPASDGGTFDTISPDSREVIAKVSHATKEDVDKAVAAARKAFETTWGTNITPGERAALMFKLADAIEANKDRIAEIESLDNGKPILWAREMDVAETVSTIRYYAGYADKIHGQVIDVLGKEKLAMTLVEPLGVCGLITAWNYPLMLWAWKMGPALATGNTVVIKPSEMTSLTTLQLAELAVEVGFPPGVINVVPGLGATTGQAISEHPDIDKVSFTGSVPTGKKIAAAAAATNLKKVTLELGGKSPVLIFDSAARAMEDTVNWAVLGVFFNSGEDCSAGTRLLVQEGIYDEFVDKFTQATAALQTGNLGDDKTVIGAMISEAHLNKVLSYIKYGKEDGGRITTGGYEIESEKGYYVKPTVIADVSPTNRAYKDEIFGPVAVISKFSTEEEAIALANDSTYGLAGGVYTQDPYQGLRVAREIKAGSIWVNQYTCTAAQVPFGGYKMSGYGRELGEAAISAYTQVKAVHYSLGMAPWWP